MVRMYPIVGLLGICAFHHSDGFFTENSTFEPGNLGQPFWDHIIELKNIKETLTSHQELQHFVSFGFISDNPRVVCVTLTGQAL